MSAPTTITASSTIGLTLPAASETIASGVTITNTGGSYAVTGTISPSDTLTNLGVISGSFGGVRFASNPGTLINGGGVSGASVGIALVNGGAITNQSTGTIAGTGTVGNGVWVKGGTVTVDNQGSISGAGSNGMYFFPAAGAGTVINEASASVYGATTGIAFKNGGTVTNTGTITGHSQFGVYGDPTKGATVTNVAAGYIIGGTDGVLLKGTSTVSNAGKIKGGTAAGANLTNSSTGTIWATGQDGVDVSNGVGTIVNAGRIAGGTREGAFLNAGGRLTNTATGTIVAGTTGAAVLVQGTLGTVVNLGILSSSGGDGLDLFAGGFATNAVNATISGSRTGVEVAGANGTVSNAGTITGGSYDGIQFASVGFVTNASSGTISGGTSGIGSTADLSVSNDGTISGIVGVTTFGTLTLNNTGKITATTRGVNDSVSGTVTNSGQISGGSYGVGLNGAASTVTNSGTINGTKQWGVDLFLGGGVSNSAGGLISSANYAVFSNGDASFSNAGTIAGGVEGIWDTHAISLSNSGSISGSSGAGVFVGDGGFVTNAAGGTISGGRYGVSVYGSAATVVNAGSIGGTTQSGVTLTAGGAVTNASGAVITGGMMGVAIGGASPGTVDNAGGISSADSLFAVGVSIAGGGEVNNEATGRISGESAIAITGSYGTVGNAGTIVGDKWNGVYLGAGGTVTNSGSVSAYADAVVIKGGAGTVVNSGTMSQTGNAGYVVYLAGDGIVTNAAGARMNAAVDGVKIAGANATIVNDGTLTAPYYGVILYEGGSITNDSGALIEGSTRGVWVRNADGTLDNAGTIEGGFRGGVQFDDGGVVTNSAAGTIYGTGGGVAITGAAGSVDNAGTIGSATYASAVTFGDVGTLTNQASGTVAGGSYGVHLMGATGTVTNAGSIGATGGYGVRFGGDGTLTNDATGKISGGIDAVVFDGADGTVTNNGLISGGFFGVMFNNASATPGFDGLVINNASATIAGGVEFNGSGNATVVNDGTIDQGPVGVFGLQRDIYVTNASGALISSTSGDAVIGGTGTVFNSGTISSDFRGVYLANGTVINNGVIRDGSSDAQYGVAIGGQGTIINNSYVQGGLVTANGYVLNAAGATVVGGPLGLGPVGNGTIINDGTVEGDARDGIDAVSSGTTNIAVVANNAFASGQYGAKITAEFGGQATLTNNGTLTGTVAGVRVTGENFSTAYVTNAAGGTITGTQDGLQGNAFAGGVDISNAGGGTIAGSVNGLNLNVSYSGVAYVHNQGLISGGTGDGIVSSSQDGNPVFPNGVNIANASGATITGGANGVNLAVAPGYVYYYGTVPSVLIATVANDGVITGGTGDGVRVNASATAEGYNYETYSTVSIGTYVQAQVTNTAGAVISGGANGVNMMAGTAYVGFASFDVVNDGTISGTVYDGVRVTGFADVTVSNTATIVGARNGIYIAAYGTATGTVTLPGGTVTPPDPIIYNTNSIIGVSGDGVFVSSGNTYLTNTSTGTISGGHNGVYLNNSQLFSQGGVDAVTNAGTISGVTGDGVYLRAGGVVTNASGAVISGKNGVAIDAGGGTVTNAGSIAGNSLHAGVFLNSGGSVTNTAGGVIGGGYGVFARNDHATLYNDGSISGSMTGVYLQGGSITNAVDGVISGATGVSDGIDAVTIDNAGSILSSGGEGIRLSADGEVTNVSGGVISGRYGIEDVSGVVTVSNAGSISGSSMGIYAWYGATVSNAAGGVITGGVGVDVYSDAATVSNAGTISGGTVGVSIGGGGYVYNNGLIQGGVDGFYASLGGTIVNDGSITGTTGDAVRFVAGYDNTVIFDVGASFQGAVDGGDSVGGNGVSTLVLNTGASTGTISALGSKYLNFDQIDVVSNASWEVDGATNSLSQGVTISNAGTLSFQDATLTGGAYLYNTGAVSLDPSQVTVSGIGGAGSETIDTGSTLTVTGTIVSGNTVVFDSIDTSGTATVLALGDATGLSPDNVGTIAGFAPGDAIDLSNIPFLTGDTAWAAGGTIHVQYNGSIVASFHEQNTSTAPMKVVDDGHGDELVIFGTSEASATVSIQLGTDTGALCDDGFGKAGNTSVDVLTGTANAFGTVVLTEGTAPLGTATADASGSWTFTPSTLTQGTHTILATETEGQATATDTLSFVYDTVPPKVSMSLGAGYDDEGDFDGGGDGFGDNRDGGESYSGTSQICGGATGGDDGGDDDKSTGYYNHDTLTGKGDPNLVVTVYDGTTSLGTTTADAQGSWTFTPSTLSQGTHTLVAVQEDAACNDGTASLSFIYDTIAPIPTLSLGHDTGRSIIDRVTNNPELTGAGEANTFVSIYDITNGGSAYVGKAKVSQAGSWTFDFNPNSFPTEGTHSFVATDTDLAGNIGASDTLTAEFRFTASTPNGRLTQDTGSSPTDRITSSDGLSGTAATRSGLASPFALVSVKEGTSVLGTTTADASGSWSFTPATLSQGTHTLTMQATDIAGNVGTSSLTFVYDTVAPGVTEGLANDTGVSASDKITSVATLTGSGDAYTVVTLKEGTATLGTATANAQGAWSFTPTGLAQGTHTIVASETDAAGNVGTTSLTFVYDTVAPGVTEALSNDTGASSTDKVTSVATLTGSADANAVVTLKEGWTVLGSTTANAQGTWSFTPTSLSQGSHTIVASVADVAGNVGTSSLTFVYDTVAPGVTEALANDTGASSSDKVTSVATLTGSGDANAVVTLKEGTATLGTVTANAQGTWSFAPASLAQGTHTIVANETDAAGNVSTTSLTFVYDTVAPSVTEVLANDTGVSSTDKLTSVATLTGSSDANAVVTLKEGSAVIGTATANAQGTWSFTPASLTQGTHTIAASETDAAGNGGTTGFTFVYDTQAPTGFTTTPTANGTANGASGLGSTSIAALAGKGLTGDQYSFALASGPSGGLTMSSAGTLATTGLTGIANGKVFTANVVVSDATNGVAAASSLPIAVVVGSSGNDSINPRTLGIAASTPTFIYSLGGTDTINGTGMTGALTFEVAVGKETMTGGSGVNDYMFGAVADSTPAAMDVITNFGSLDILDFTSFDGGKLKVAGALTGTSVAAGTVGWQTSGSSTFVYVNNSLKSEAFSAADMKIQLNGAISLSSGNFHV